jgi:hypothetical protein
MTDGSPPVVKEKTTTDERIEKGAKIWP